METLLLSLKFWSSNFQSWNWELRIYKINTKHCISTGHICYCFRWAELRCGCQVWNLGFPKPIKLINCKSFMVEISLGVLDWVIKISQRSKPKSTKTITGLWLLQILNQEDDILVQDLNTFQFKFHWFREKLKLNGIEVIKVETKDQIADIFTMGVIKDSSRGLRQILLGWYWYTLFKKVWNFGELTLYVRYKYDWNQWYKSIRH